MQDKVALVTGANGGIGLAITKTLQQEGVKVITTDMTLTEAGDHHIEGNLTDPGFCDGLPEQAAEVFGRLDILVNNAGVMRRGPITDATDEDFQLSMAVNVEAPFRLCRAAIPPMEKAGGGAIVSVASC